MLGGGALGAAVAGLLCTNGAAVRHVDEGVDEADGTDADPTDLPALETAGVADASTVIVATRSDRRNFLIAQLIRTRFGVDRIVVLTNDPERHDTTDDAGHDQVCATTALSIALVESV